MSPRDYKNTASKSKGRTRPVGSWVSFISGFGSGLVVAAAVYLWGGVFIRSDNTGPQPSAATEETAGSGVNFEEQLERVLPKREFDFYKILPEIEIKVPDWEISNSEAKPDNKFERGTYVLQVGSFKQFKDADRAKAQLALRGIRAKIHRVVINGQDIWYRVHVGPFSDIANIQATRAKLIESGNDFILLRIGDVSG